MYDYSTDYISLDSSASLAMGGAVAAVYVISLIISVISIVAMWKVFKKAGKPGWASIIPVYNLVVMFQICGINPLMVILMFIPFVNFIAIPVLSIMQNIKLAKKFGKSGGFAVGLIFLNFIFMLILAFGNAKYEA